MNTRIKNIIPSQAELEQAILHAQICTPETRVDSQLAPIWASKLRYTYSQVLEQSYPDLQFASGDVLPIDTNVDPASIEWEYFTVDHYGVADWIDDCGCSLNGSASSATRTSGKMHEMGKCWNMSIFDLERHVKAGTNIRSNMAQKEREAHDRKTDWVWAFGDRKKGLMGLLNHPNITVVQAAQNAAGTSRLWANKTDDEILADFKVLISSIPRITKQRHYAATVWMPFELYTVLSNRKPEGDCCGFPSLLKWLEHMYEGDDKGQPRVQFRILNYADKDWRCNPLTQTDDSGIVGNFIFVTPRVTEDMAAFIRARPFTQLPPQTDGFCMKVKTHSKIGGVRLLEPLAFLRMDFGLV